jgi:hypothetical protein
MLVVKDKRKMKMLDGSSTQEYYFELYSKSKTEEAEVDNETSQNAEI